MLVVTAAALSIFGPADGLRALRSEPCAREARMPTPEDGTGKLFVDIDAKKAMKVCRKAVAVGRGNVAAHANLGRALLKAGKPEEAVRHFHIAAEAGVTQAQQSLNLAYARGSGVEENAKQSFQWHLKAAEAGYWASVNTISARYQSGDGVDVNPEQGAAWSKRWKLALVTAVAQYKTRAAQGDLDAFVGLGDTAFVGFSDRNGERLVWDPREGGRLYLAAAERGHVPAMLSVGTCYRIGDGCPVDYSKALFWLKKAEAGGSAEAQAELGHMHALGMGVEQNAQTAFAYYYAAAKAGSATAMQQLGYAFRKGLGVQVDLEQSRSWFHQAALRGDPTSIDELASPSPTKEEELHASLRRGTAW